MCMIVVSSSGGSCLAACRAGRDEPLRWEVPRRACPEAQEGRAWMPVELAVMSHCVGMM